MRTLIGKYTLLKPEEEIDFLNKSQKVILFEMIQDILVLEIIKYDLDSSLRKKS